MLLIFRDLIDYMDFFLTAFGSFLLLNYLKVVDYEV